MDGVPIHGTCSPIHGRGGVGVDKIIRINLSTEGPVSPYIHERLS